MLGDVPPVAAAVVSMLGLYVVGIRLQRKDLGPEADWWERVRRWVFPIADQLLRERSLGFAAATLPDSHHVGLVHASPEEVEQLLWDRGYVRNPVSSYKRTSDGLEEVGSWVYRPDSLATRQIHVMLFDPGPDGVTEVYAHYEYSSINPLVAWRHLRGVDLVPLGDYDAGRLVHSSAAALYRQLREEYDE